MEKENLAIFAAEEYQRRLAGLKALMAENNMDAVLITTEANHRYITGHVTHRWTHNYTAIFALVPLEGKPVLIVTPMEACMCQADSWIETIRTFSTEHTLQGVAAITETIQDLGLEKGRIGTELAGMAWMRMPFEDFGQLCQNLPQIDFVDASPLLWQLRARKSAAEVDLIRQAVSITDAAYDVLAQALKPGMTERDVYRLLATEHMNRGADMPGSITIAPYWPGDIRTVNSTLRRHTDQVLPEGVLIAQDAGGVYRGYWSDYTRMFALGRALAAHKEAYCVVYDCMQAAISATKAGVPIAALVHASKARMSALGYAEHAERVSGIGHAMGSEIIEYPFISFENDVLLEEGMILTIEPSIYIEGAFIMVEEDVLVTDQGYEVLSAPASAELPIL
jgi:Xaa-Pro dipeptidase